MPESIAKFRQNQGCRAFVAHICRFDETLRILCLIDETRRAGVYRDLLMLQAHYNESAEDIAKKLK